MPAFLLCWEKCSGSIPLVGYLSLKAGKEQKPELKKQQDSPYTEGKKTGTWSKNGCMDHADVKPPSSVPCLF